MTVVKAAEALGRTIEYKSSDLEDQSNFPRCVSLSGEVLDFEVTETGLYRLKTPSGWLNPVPGVRLFVVPQASTTIWSKANVQLRTHGLRHRGYNIE